MMDKQQFVVRSGKGTIRLADPVHAANPMQEFTDSIAIVERVPRQHSNWQSVTYKGKRYQLFGGVRTFWFICLDHPLKPN